MDDDRQAAVTLAEREEEMKVGARALTRRLKGLEARVVALRDDLADVGWEVIHQIETLEDDIFRCRWGLYELTANAIGGDYNAADVALWCERAVEMGAIHPRLDYTLLLDLIHVRKVPNEPFRVRMAGVLGSSFGDANSIKARIVVKVHQLLSKMEQDRGGQYGAASLLVGERRIPQGRTLERWLGIQTCPGRDNYPPSLRLFVSYEQAEALALALDMSPHQAGI